MTILLWLTAAAALFAVIVHGTTQFAKSGNQPIRFRQKRPSQGR
ncbi:Uncharacterised protein [Burkholderia pseudomallei]|nr:Uncharacterised protein [Burkholderia pseudomallei]